MLGILNVPLNYLLAAFIFCRVVANGLQLMWLYITKDTFIIDAVTAVVFFAMTISILNPGMDTSSAGWGIARVSMHCAITSYMCMWRGLCYRV